MMTTLILFILLFAQTEDYLLGHWKCAKEEYLTKMDINVSFTDKPTKPSCYHEFTLMDNGVGLEHTMEENFSYETKDTLLLIGNRLYVIEKLSSDSLVMRDFKDTGLINSSKRYHMYKVINGL